MLDFISANSTYLISAGVVGLVLFVATLVGVPVALASLPPDYFLRQREFSAYRVRDWIIVILSNVLGWLVILVGVWMLIAPGQGILTILVGLMLIDFPGKRRLQRWLLQQPGVKSSVGWIRRKAGKEPLKLDEDGEAEIDR